MKLILRFLGFLFAAGTILFVVGVAGAAGLLWHFSKDLPDYSQLQDYEPPVMTRVHAADGSLVAEYARERRLYIPIQAVPKLVINAFLAAEDKNFYEHGGLDFTGIARAGFSYIQNYGSSRRPQGASTITQQVAKNFLLTNEVSFTRKIKEALLALKIERTYSKDKILELYLNEIYLGLGAYGIAAASLVYFDKAVNELTVPEAAYLAALPKAPNNYHPFRQRERAIERRNWVIDRMAESAFVKSPDAEKAKRTALGVTTKANGGVHIFAAEYFAEEVRRELYDRYGEKKLYEGGLSVRTSLDTKLQVLARKTLTDGLVKYDEARGWRGAVSKIDISGDWGVKLAEVKALADIAPWRLATVLEVGDQAARIGLQPGREPGGYVSKERDIGIVPLEGVKWAKTGGKVPAKVSQVLSPGDVIYVEPAKADGQFRLHQVPEVSGAMVVEDPWTGRVLAMVGGFSYEQSQFNRATQALRQPGSSFKPFVYLPALELGIPPNQRFLDAPIEIMTAQGVWRPGNYGDGVSNSYVTLRRALEKSLNLVTIRVAQEVGMDKVAETAARFGVIPNMPKYLSMSLGSGESTVLRMAAGYAAFVNGGREVTPTLIDSVQDQRGRVVWRSDPRDCAGCASANPNAGPPELTEERKQITDPIAAYQMVNILTGVVQRGTGTRAGQGLNRPVAGKTGTTNDYMDNWFVGFTPDLVVAVWLGFDEPKTLGNGETGGQNAAPIFRDVMEAALRGSPPVPFRAPPGVALVRMQAEGGASIMEAFRPGTENAARPPDEGSPSAQLGPERALPGLY